MLKKYILGLIVALSVPMLVAYAAPTFSFSGTGTTGTNASAATTITGGVANSAVVLYYTDAGGFMQSRTIGMTDANGNFSGSIDTTGWSFNSGSPLYVMINGQQSGSIMWPTNTSTTTSSNIIFNQTWPTYSIGQTGTIVISGANGPYYIASNSNQNAMSASLSGNVLTVNGSQSGSGAVTVCSSVTGACGILNVNIGTTGSGQTNATSPMLSQGSITVNQGQSGNITLSGGVSPYTVSVLNGNGVSTVLNGNTLSINGVATGTTMLTVCSASGGGCTPLNVSVQSQVNNPMGFTLSLPYASAAKLMLTGGNGNYYLQSSSNANVNASISGNTLTMMGSAQGNGVVTICSTGSSTCMPINIAVDAATAPTMPTTGIYNFGSNLTLGMRGQDVLELQNRLKAEGHFNATATGYFGPVTASAVRSFQSANGISAVGQVGPQTRVLLNQ